MSHKSRPWVINEICRMIGHKRKNPNKSRPSSEELWTIYSWVNIAHDLAHKIRKRMEKNNGKRKRS